MTRRSTWKAAESLLREERAKVVQHGRPGADEFASYRGSDYGDALADGGAASPSAPEVPGSSSR
jgi:hypothetical protein